EVRAGGLCGEHRPAVGNRARENQWSVEPGADFLEQSERRPAPGVAAGAGSYRDDPIGAFLDRLAGVAIVNHIVERDPAPGVHRVVELDPGAERGDDDRHFPFGADLEIMLEPVVRT